MKNNIRIALSFALLLLVALPSNSQNIRLFAGRYNDTGGDGLYLLDFHPESGTFRLLTETNAGPDPSYFCISKNKRLIYAANEVMDFNGIKGGGVTALKYDEKSNKIEKVRDLMVPYGGPCFITLSPDEKFLLFASYSSASIAVVKLDENGNPSAVADTLSFAPDYGKVSHPHMMAFDPAGKKVYLTDLGLDRIMIFNFNSASGHLSQVKDGVINLPKGSGPRHFVFNSSGSKLYVICELSSNIFVYDVLPSGILKNIQTISAIDQGYKGDNACADIHLGKSGKFLYGTNRGENSIVTFKVAENGKLTLAGRKPCGGNWPRNFVIDPSGRYILVGNQKSGDISVFKINEKTGVPDDMAKSYKLATPACLKFLP